MNKAGKIVAGAGIIFVLAAIGIVIAKSNTKHQVENAHTLDAQRAYDDGGMYYFDGAGRLMYLANTTGENVPVCNKTNCTHTIDTCDALYPGVSGMDILLYDDRIYISYFKDEWYSDSDGTERLNRVTKIETSKKDGSDRKTIYQADTGAVLTMLAMDGKLYYTSYINLFPDKMNTYYNDVFLYCYDMDWGTTKKLAESEASDTNYSSGFYLLESSDKKALYLLHGYEVLQGDDEIWSEEIITMDLKGKVIAREIPEKEVWPGKGIKASENGIDWGDFVVETDDEYAETCLQRLYRRTADGKGELLFEAMCGHLGRQEEDFYYAIMDERRKLLYDCEEDTYYIAKSAVSDEGIVPDIWYIDRDQDVIYYDTTDYTGVAPGTLFTEKPSVEGCMKWSEFLDCYFVLYEGQEIEGLTVYKEEGNN